MKKLVAFLVLLMVVSVVLPAMASTSYDSSYNSSYEKIYGYGVSTPVVTKEKSQLVATANPQAAFMYCGQSVWQWSAAMGEYARDLPTGIGGVIRIYPNVDAQLQGVMGVYIAMAELTLNIKDITQDARFIPCQREMSGRWFADIPIDLYPGPQYVRIYAKINNGKRSDYTILWFVHIGSRKDSTQMVDHFEYTTSPWYGPQPRDVTELATTMRRAGVGGSGLAYYQLARADGERQGVIDSNNQALEKYRLEVEAYRQEMEKFRNGQTKLSATVDQGNGSVQFCIKFLNCHYSLVKVWLKSPNGSIQTFDVTSSEAVFNYPSGDYQFKFAIPGKGEANWAGIKVYAGMGPVNVTIHGY